MILTLTANPSNDRTVDLGSPLVRGAVMRATGVRTQAGGKGVNISRAATQAGVATVAVLPASEQDPFVAGLRADGIACRPVPAGPVRTNLTLTEPDGTTTKINTPGGPVDAHLLGALADALLAELDRRVLDHGSLDGAWAVLAGSLPPGAPAAWYAEVASRLRERGVRVAIDTSDAPLAALAGRLDDAAPDLLKPNGEELVTLLRALGEEPGAEAHELERDPAAAGAAASLLVARGVGAVLTTLGAGGAVLATADGAWHGTPPPTTVLSTVGAGDCSLFGYLSASLDDAPPARRLAAAVAWGSAAAALPGTTIPHPDQVDPDLVLIRELDLATTPGGNA